MNALSYTLFNCDKTIGYANGMLRNLELAQILYPGWITIIHHDDTVPESLLNAFVRFKGTLLFQGDRRICPYLWRFLPVCNARANVVLPRDADSVLNIRERFAVQEWLDSGLPLHTMRDHPDHRYKMLGGLSGFRQNKHFFNWIAMYQKPGKFSSEHFLSDHVYSPEKIMVHAIDELKYEGNARSFPVELPEGDFCGKIETRFRVCQL